MASPRTIVSTCISVAWPSPGFTPGFPETDVFTIEGVAEPESNKPGRSRKAPTAQSLIFLHARVIPGAVRGKKPAERLIFLRSAFIPTPRQRKRLASRDHATSCRAQKICSSKKLSPSGETRQQLTKTCSRDGAIRPRGRNNERTMPKTTRIEIPSSESELIQLAGKIKAKHATAATASPLSALPWSDVTERIDEAVENDARIAVLDAELEQRRQQRGNHAKELAEFVRSSRDVLQGVHRDTLRKLNDWGFKVDDTPRPKKSATPTAGSN